MVQRPKEEWGLLSGSALDPGLYSEEAWDGRCTSTPTLAGEPPAHRQYVWDILASMSEQRRSPSAPVLQEKVSCLQSGSRKFFWAVWWAHYLFGQAQKVTCYHEFLGAAGRSWAGWEPRGSRHVACAHLKIWFAASIREQPEAEALSWAFRSEEIRWSRGH